MKQIIGLSLPRRVRLFVDIQVYNKSTSHDKGGCWGTEKHTIYHSISWTATAITYWESNEKGIKYRIRFHRVTIVLEDAKSPSGARPSAGTVLTIHLDISSSVFVWLSTFTFTDWKKLLELTNAVLRQFECQIVIVFYRFWSCQSNMIDKWM